jgi:hypothetical protein
MIFLQKQDRGDAVKAEVSRLKSRPEAISSEFGLPSTLILAMMRGFG